MIFGRERNLLQAEMPGLGVCYGWISLSVACSRTGRDRELLLVFFSCTLEDIG